jgi:thiol-disulfide isomerase/thioredoxin
MRRSTFIASMAIALTASSLCAFPFNLGDEMMPAPTPAPKVAEVKTEVLLFSASSWCGPCRALTSKLKTKGLYKKIKLMDCNSLYNKYAKEYKFSGVPTVIVMKNGKEIARGNSGNAESLIRKFTQ